MTIKLLSEKWGELPFTNEYPRTPENLYFPGAEMRLAQSATKAYCYLIQELKVKFFTIRFYCFFSNVNDVITVVTETPAIIFRLAHSHTHEMITEELGKQVFHERSYNL